jgi:hypothetical protein
MKLVNVRKDKCTHYIGRRSSYLGTEPHGEFANLGNMYNISATMDRATVVAAFERLVRKTPDMLKRIEHLPADAVLGCWCAPLACHGDVIIKIWKELHHG